MPRDAVGVTALTTNAANTNPAGTTINTTNGASIGQYDPTRTVIRITNTAGAEKTVTIKAGTNPPAVRKGISDLTVQVPATTGDILLAIEPSRFEQADGTISVDYEAGHTGKISAVQVSKGI